ncbi:hypothetical protein B0I37DRAFT_418601 [Chaetomium sp. MPI-CAGE-AT-0009]|nr:hypothetical protein B0I37DRAFT_418601 [Chaetomium sp. MPI-CAGE-AT-0009]
MVSTRSGSKRLASRAKTPASASPVAKRIRKNAESAPAPVATPAVSENDPVVEQITLSVEDEDVVPNEDDYDDGDDYNSVYDSADDTGDVSDPEGDEELEDDLELGDDIEVDDDTSNEHGQAVQGDDAPVPPVDPVPPFTGLFVKENVARFQGLIRAMIRFIHDWVNSDAYEKDGGLEREDRATAPSFARYFTSHSYETICQTILSIVGKTDLTENPESYETRSL